MNPQVMVKNALQQPVDGNGLDIFSKKGQTVTIIVDDYTRPTPAGPVCVAILDELNALGTDDAHVTIIVGGGLHRSMNRAELEAKLGCEVIRRVEVSCHNAWDDDQNEQVGTTSRGTPLWIDKQVARADLRITVGLIIGHFTAGYGGGPKTILPGVSGYRTIFHNHGALQSAPSARIGVTEGNPAWEDMAEAIRFLGPTLAVNVVLNTKNELVGAFHGKPVAAQRAGMKLYHSIYAFKVKEKADIVIASAYPEHAYLDQCLKTIVPTSMFVKDGGVRIIASPCREHLGPPFLRELYYNSLTPDWPSPERYEELLRSGKIKDAGDAVGILKLLQSNRSDLILVSDPSFDQDLTNLKIAHRNTVHDALNETTRRLGSNSRVLIVPYGPITLPIP
jgi:nickel-dependent lactate racemase